MNIISKKDKENRVIEFIFLYIYILTLLTYIAICE